MLATPTLSITGLVTNTEMSLNTSATVWEYLWNVPSSVTTGTYTVSVNATDTSNRTYSRNETLDITIDPVFYLATNGVTIKCPTASNGDTGVVGGKTYTAVNRTALLQKVTDGDSDFDCICTSLVTDMKQVFQNQTAFNQDISSWDTSNVTTIFRMFQNAQAFNQDISDWDTSSVTNMEYAFYQANVFNQNISTWNTVNVTSMEGMFRKTGAFNQPIGSWNISNVVDLSYMFYQAVVFNQNINSWDILPSPKCNIYSKMPAFNQPFVMECCQYHKDEFHVWRRNSI